MCYGMYYDKKEGKWKEISEAKAPEGDEKEEKAYSLLKSLKNKKVDNRQFAQMREEYYRALGDLN